MFRFLFIAAALSLSSCSTQYFIVRHAEKETATTMSTDVPLSAAGTERAAALGQQLGSRKVRHIFSTNTIRTTTTAKPLSEASGISIAFYNQRDTLDRFISRLKNLPKGNVLIVGHSNTVDDLVNALVPGAGLQDLPETQYGDLFIVRKKGNSFTLTRSRYGR